MKYLLFSGPNACFQLKKGFSAGADFQIISGSGLLLST
jgi:hypothetical protein